MEFHHEGSSNLENASRSKPVTSASDYQPARSAVRNDGDQHETYVPIHGDGTGKVIAVAEFYQTTDEMEREAWAARRNSWGVVAFTVLTMYLLLSDLRTISGGLRLPDIDRLPIAEPGKDMD